MPAGAGAAGAAAARVVCGPAQHAGLQLPVSGCQLGDVPGGQHLSAAAAGGAESAGGLTAYGHDTWRLAGAGGHNA